MLQYIAVVVGIVIIVLAVLIYRHDNTNFAKLTGLSFIDITVKSKAKKMYELTSILNCVPGEHRVLIDLKVPEDHETYDVAAILVHESGVYIISTEHQNGWIVGNERYAEWVNVSYKDKQQTFDNPILQNKRIEFALHEILPEISRDAFVNVVVFEGGCSFQKVEIQSDSVEVLKWNELKDWTKTIGGEVLSKQEIDSIYNALEPYMSFYQQQQAMAKRKAEAVNS